MQLYSCLVVSDQEHMIWVDLTVCVLIAAGGTTESRATAVTGGEGGSPGQGYNFGMTPSSAGTPPATSSKPHKFSFKRLLGL